MTEPCHSSSETQRVLTADQLRAHMVNVNKSRLTAEDRFWSYLSVASPEECWEWRGAKGRWGYGQLFVKNRSEKAHRISYILHHGPIPPGMVVMHSCDNPPCCNPAHLSVGTQRDNMDDMVAKNRHPGAPRGLANVHGKVTDDEVRAIRAARAAGESCASIGRRMGLTDSYVSLVVRGLRRADVTDELAAR